MIKHQTNAVESHVQPAESNTDEIPDGAENRVENDLETDNRQLSDNPATEYQDGTVENKKSTEHILSYDERVPGSQQETHDIRKGLHSDNDGNSRKSSAFRCKYCDEYFSRQSGLTRHLRTHLPDALRHARARVHLPRLCQVSSNNVEKQNQTTKKPSTNHFLLYKCKVCTMYFTSKAKRIFHEKVHFKCKKCSKQFKKLCNLKTHTQTHIGEMPPEAFKCFTCYKVFMQIEELNAHRLAKHADGTKDVKPTFIQAQQAFGSGLKLYTCTFCGKNVGDRSKLLEHERVHTGERPFPCTMCPFRFKRKCHLKRHMDTHLKDRRFKCNIFPCLQYFTDKRELGSHLSSVHKESETSSASAAGFVVDSKATTTTGSSSPLFEYKDVSGGRSGMVENIPGDTSGDMQMPNDNHSSKENPSDVHEFFPPNNTAVKNSNLPTSTSKSKSKAGKIFECRICEKSFNRHDRLIRHMGTHTSFKCSRCHKYFTGKKRLATHTASNNCIRETGASSPDPPGTTEEIASSVESTGVSRGSVKLQNDYGDKRTSKQSRSTTLAGDQRREPVVDKPCGEKIQTKKLFLHNKRKGEKLNFVSTDVGDRLMNNNRRNSSNCRVCKKCFCTARNRILHERIHTKPFQCDICLRRFPHQRNLQAHKLTHLPDAKKPYQCHPCSKSFVYRRSLKRHLNSTLHHCKVIRNVGEVATSETSVGAEAETGVQLTLTRNGPIDPLLRLPEDVSMTLNPAENNCYFSNEKKASVQLWIDSSDGVHGNLAVEPHL